jgi:hypothetical protein
MINLRILDANKVSKIGCENIKFKIANLARTPE